MFLKMEAASIGMTLNSTKTKYLVAGIYRGRLGGLGAEVEFDGYVFLKSLFTLEHL